MKKRLTEMQIVGFLREAEAGVAVKDSRGHGVREWYTPFRLLKVSNPYTPW